MKKRIILLLAISMIICLVFAISFIPASADVYYTSSNKTNLISNGDFENGSVGWTSENLGANSGITSNNSVSGNAYRMSLAEGGMLYNVINIFPAYDLNIINQKDTDYIVTSYAKKGNNFVAGNNSFRMVIRIIIADADNAYVDIEPTNKDKIAFTAADNDYVMFTQSITLQEKYKVGETYYKWYSMQILFLAGESIGDVYIDDVSMVYDTTDTSATDNFFNSSVTKDSALGVPYGGSDLFFASGVGDAYSIDVTTSYKNSEGASLKYTPQANNTGGVNFYITIPIDSFANDLYHFSFMVKGKNASTNNGTPAQYPYGIYAFPWLRTDGGGDTRIPERLTYKTDDSEYSYRPFLNCIYANGGVIVTEETRDFDWKEVSFTFNPHAFVSEALGIDGKTYSYDKIVDMALIIYTEAIQGEYWFDSFKLYRDGTDVPDYTNDFSLTAEQVKNWFYNEEVVLPAPYATSLIGDKNVDISNEVTLTVIEPDGNVLINDLLATETNRMFTTNKYGFYRVVFKVSSEGRERTLQYEFKVADKDLNNPVISVKTEMLSCKAGESLKLPNATVFDLTEGSLTNSVFVEVKDASGNIIMSKRQANVQNGCYFKTSGTYYAVYTAVDSSGNFAEEVSVEILVEETLENKNASGCGSVLSIQSVNIAAASVVCVLILIKTKKLKQG